MLLVRVVMIIGFNYNIIIFNYIDCQVIIQHLKTSAKFRDRSAWYHIVVLFANSTEATASNRIKLYVNGEQVTSFSTDN
jgi:hypothetical protein